MSMKPSDAAGQPPGASWSATVYRCTALVGGFVLIYCGKASPAEAAAYVSPFIALGSRR